MRKAVFFDIDGTLIGRDGQLPESTKRAIATLNHNGIFTAIATGRGPHTIQPLLKELNMNSYVSFNGQYVVCLNKVISKHYLDSQHLKSLSEAVEKHHHEIIYLNEAALEMEQQTHESFAAWKKAHMENRPKGYSDIYQAIIFVKDDEDYYLKDFNDYYSFVRWSDKALDVIPAGRSKAEAIKAMARKLKIDMKDVYTFGDGLNDIEMLQQAGVGIAMGNAHNEVKKHADFVTTDVDDDGIVRGLQEVGLLSEKIC
ncbi:Cof-type HAD-IIB family hydrolase [Lederbergia ruris]|uniref:Phosphatase n=1 Tax=Lederbergia ruris TaxID=217495 RepID=A0ABQ4KLK8_9BACI|nr:Cof-type HAD-IIB family hydrolase [Lederbergia ruris]GIN58366.1 phosphatase [Lederbergia ruris]